MFSGKTNPELRQPKQNSSSDVPDYLSILTGRLWVANDGKPEPKWIKKKNSAGIYIESCN